MKKYIKLGLIGLAVCLAVGAKAALFPGTEPLQYLTEPVSRGDIRETVLATGTLEAFKQVSVGAQASGQVKSLKVELGDTVQKGSLIAEIDSQSQENALRIAEADLQNIQAQRAAKEATLLQAESEYKRQKGMLKAKATSRQDYESALATYTETKAEIAALDAQIVAAGIDVDTARVELGYTSITAPMGRRGGGRSHQGRPDRERRPIHADHRQAGAARHHDRGGRGLRGGRHPRPPRPAGVLHHPGRPGQQVRNHPAKHRARPGFHRDRRRHRHHQLRGRGHLLQRPVRRAQPGAQAAHLHDRGSDHRPGRGVPAC